MADTNSIKGKGLKGFVLHGNEESQKLVIQINVPFLVLKRRKRFTQMDEPESDVNDLTKDRSNQYYQRRIDPKRTKAIAEFIQRSILSERRGLAVATLFPTSMLIATSLEDTKLNVGEDCFLDLDSDDLDIYIIDGQHRLSGMVELYEAVCKIKNPDDNTKYIKDYLESYKFNCSLMLNFDMWEQAQVFADVNFNQKKVSKDLYYTIYGMHYPESDDDKKKDYIYIAHRLVLLLNSYEMSPLYRMIRMIGSGSTGVMSQSYLADSLIRNLRHPRGIWHSSVSKPKPRMRPIAVECMTFFMAVKYVFNKEWIVNGKHSTILTKTTGIGALIRLMEYIHTKLSTRVIDSILDVTEGYYSKEYYDIVIYNLNIIKSKLPNIFSFKGEFAGTGGRGLEKRMFDKFKEALTQ